MLSIEILSEVLSDKIVNCCTIEDNKVLFREVKSTLPIKWSDYAINTHELMSLCKKWLCKDEEIVVQTSMYGTDSFVCLLLKNNDYLTFIRKFKDSTEYNAVFKACAWVLENNEIKQGKINVGTN